MRIDPSAIYRKNQGNVKGEKGLSKRGQIVLSEGEVLKGEILDASQTGVKIKLSNGHILEARLTRPSQFSIGDQVQFIVKNSASDQLLLIPSGVEESQMMDKLLGILAEANLPGTEKNLALVEKLIELQMPVDPKTVKTLVNQMKQFPKVELKQLLFMTQHHIPVTKENIEQLTQFENGEHALMKGITTLLDTWLKKETTLSVSGQNKIETTLDLPENVEKTQLMEVLLKDSKGVEFQRVIASSLKGEPILEIKATSTTQIPIIEIMLAKDGDELIKNLTSKVYASLESMPEEALTQKGQSLLDQLAQPSKLNLTDVWAMAKENLLTQKQLRNFLIQIKEQSLYATAMKGLLVSEKALQDVSELKNYFEHLYSRMTKLLNVDRMNQTLGTKIKDQANHIKASVEFLNAINQDFNVVHLPLFLKEELIHAELYIKDSKKSLKNEKESVTVLIRLDLLNLGHMDIHVLKTRKNLTLQFFMTDETQLTVMQQHIPELYPFLKKKGFNVLSATVQPLKKNVTSMTTFLEEDNKSREIKRYTFDMRA